MKIDYFYITFTFVSRYAFKLICHITNLLQKFSHQFLLRVKKRGNKSLSRRHHFSNQTYFEGTKKKLPDFFIEAICFQYHFTHLFIILHVLFFMCLWQSWHVLWSFSIYLRWNWQFQFPSTVSSWNIDVRMCVFFFLLLMDAFVGKRGEIVMRLLE